MDESSPHTDMTAATFKRYFDLYYDKIRNFCYYKCGDTDQAEDLCQEVFLQLWNKRQSIREDTLGSLLYKIAGNLCTNAARHQQVVYRFEQRPQKEHDHEDPAYLMEVRQFHEQLQHAIASLPEGSREVFLMNRIDKMTYAEIAGTLELSVKAVEKRMNIALKKLRKLTNRKI